MGKYLRVLSCFSLVLLIAVAQSVKATDDINNATNNDGREVIIATIDGPINPATDDFLRSSLSRAENANAKLFVLKLNTPGGLLPSMQKMVEALLEAPLPTVVYVSPSGGGAISAGVFVTMAGHVAAMAPGTTIGAAHPVSGAGGDIEGDMRDKVENFTVALITAIAEQRGRNTEWAEKAVRESVSVTDREAVKENIVDLTASNLDTLLQDIEGKIVTVDGTPVTLEGLLLAPRREIEMNFKQRVVNVLSDPNIAILLGLGAMVGIGIELYHPGAILPGVMGVICLVLSLTSAQVLPISYGGLGLLILGGVFFAIEMFIPSFGIWGVAGIISLVLGSIYFIDTRMIWGGEGFEVDFLFVGSIAAIGGSILLAVVYMAIGATRRKVTTGNEGLVGKLAMVKTDFVFDESSQESVGKIKVMGELWDARIEGGVSSELPRRGAKVRVVSVEPGMVLGVEDLNSNN